MNSHDVNYALCANCQITIKRSCPNQHPASPFHRIRVNPVKLWCTTCILTILGCYELTVDIPNPNYLQPAQAQPFQLNNHQQYNHLQQLQQFQLHDQHQPIRPPIIQQQPPIQAQPPVQPPILIPPPTPTHANPENRTPPPPYFHPPREPNYSPNSLINEDTDIQVIRETRPRNIFYAETEAPSESSDDENLFE